MATLTASESEMQALIKLCNLPQTPSKQMKNIKVTDADGCTVDN